MKATDLEPALGLEREALRADLLQLGTVLGEAFASFLARGREAHPELGIDAAPFARHLARLLDLSAADPCRGLSELRPGDLYLACGCALGIDLALAVFEKQYLIPIRSFVRGIDASEAKLDELKQALRERLLVAGTGALPRVASYSGRGQLSAWVAVAARRLALSSLRTPELERAASDASLAERIAPDDDPELALARLQHADRFRAAIHGALESLEARHRLLLRLHLVDGISLSRIARSYGVSQSTLSRWLDEIRRRLRRETKRLLRASAGLGSAEMASLARALRSHLDLGISSLLRAELDGEPADRHGR